ncbi:MAG: YfcE family phosphodiesterase [Pseudomonadales bacterium]|nr:YfcE family phosphodiesterase [Pseudomonadales bacterium]MBO6596104.1 YfcE family phosphodiesterase [Pseudomonadales bacterium]MBO6822586.1 YfcE family phosphodiesterase [Pseudomonadales bacterium]
MKIGLIADTHMPGTIDALWPHASSVFRGVDMILHAGDLHTLDIVDHLSEMAPTYVSRGNGDVGIEDDRLQETWMLEASGIQIGMIHHFPSPARKPPEHLERYLKKHFPEQHPDVLVYGHTHLEDVRSVNNRLFINPGSPTLPRNQSLRPGTLGVMEIEANHIHTRLMQLTDQGVEEHEQFAAHIHPR